MKALAICLGGGLCSAPSKLDFSIFSEIIFNQLVQPQTNACFSIFEMSFNTCEWQAIRYINLKVRCGEERTRTGTQAAPPNMA